ncbi:MAG: hypothetical protein ACQSGP_16915 [Frankia sp.]
MSQADNAGFGRRAFLRWGVASVVVTGFAVGAETSVPAAAASSDFTVAPTAAGQIAVLVPGTSQNVQAPVDLGVSIDGGTAGLAAGSVVSVEFDQRLYHHPAHTRPPPGGARLAAARPAPPAPPTPGRPTTTVTLNDAIPAGKTATVIVGHLKPRRYPLDVLRGFGSPQATVDDRRSNRHQTRGLGTHRATAAAGQPWAAEAGVLWQPVTWGQGYRSYCARLASVRSVGPGAIPAGYRVRVAADAAVIRSIKVVNATLLAGGTVVGSARDISTGGVRAIEWTAQSALALRAQLQLKLTVEAGRPTGALPGIKHPTVQVVGPDAHLDTQRTSYLESVVRQDSIYDAETKTLFS